MSYFLPSSLQKRILRYALSRLGLLDVDALNLENLDIAWGKRSTFELRDVGIHTKRLSALLQLPQALFITRARIILLRLTIPSDLYQSGMLIEVHGVDIGVDAHFDSAGKEEESNSMYYRKQYEHCRKGHKADRPRSTQSYVHDPGGSMSPGIDSNDHGGAETATEELPSTTDLAQSFLQTEPTGEERASLQTAILQSQHLGQSQMSDESIEEASSVGIGADLSLPAFLANFLKGVVDRIEVRIKNVQVDFNLRLQLSPDITIEKGTPERSDHVTFRVAVGDVAVLQKPRAMERSIVNPETLLPSAPSPRQMRLTNIQFMMLSESILFSHIARSPIPSSPGTTHASTVLTAKSNPSVSLMSDRAYSERSLQSQGHVSDQQGAISSSFSELSQYHEEPVNVQNVRGLERSAMSDGEVAIDRSIDRGSCSASSFVSTTGEGRVPDGTRLSLHNLDPSLSTKADSKSPLESCIYQERNGVVNAQERQGKPSFSASFSAVCEPATDPNGVTGKLAHIEPVHTELELPPNSGCSVAEDLTESKIFSHEEASSMYMSAISQTIPISDHNLPATAGEWESTVLDHEPGGQKRPSIQAGLSSSELHLHVPGPLSKSPEGTMTQASSILQDDFQTPMPKSTVFTSINSTPSAQGKSNEAPETSMGDSNPDRSNASSQASASSVDSRTPVKLMKKILQVDEIDFEVFTRPDGSQPESDIYSDTMSVPANRKPSSRPEAKSPEEDKSTRSVSIIVNKVQIVSDMTLTKVTLLICQQIMRSLGELSPTQKESRGFSEARSKTLDLTIKIESVLWQFLDLVKGQALPRDSSPNLTDGFSSIVDGSEVLLKAYIRHLKATHVQGATTTSNRISVGKFSFGYAAADIISFDSGLKMRDSTSDILAPPNADMLLLIKVHGCTRSIELTTLPVHVLFDLRKLDETFSWFGGLSSMLDLGNSMKSTIMIADTKRLGPKSSSSKPIRGVHFEARPSPLSAQRTRGLEQNKVTARIGGLVFELQGNQSALRFEGTAMKIVCRSEGIGLVIDRLSFYGPCLAVGRTEPCLTVRSSNVRLEYLSTPKEADLERLLALVKPSRDEDKQKADDGLLINTMLRQRRQGGVLRFTVEKLKGSISDLEDLHHLLSIAEDLKQLSTVAKYLPEDDRPGILTLALIRKVELKAQINEVFGAATLISENVEAAHVAFPSLFGLGITSVHLTRNETEELVSNPLLHESIQGSSLPSIWIRFIGNEIEPTVEIRVHDLAFEYHMTTIMAMIGLKVDGSGEELLFDMATSLAILTSRKPIPTASGKLSCQDSVSSGKSVAGSRLPNIDLKLSDTVVGLNPCGSLAKGILIVEEAHMLSFTSAKEKVDIILEVNKMSMMVIDDQGDTLKPVKPKSTPSNYMEVFASIGYVPIGTLLAAKSMLQILDPKVEDFRSIDAELDGGLLLLETCADSTRTLQHIVSALIPPMPRGTELKYRTEVVPIEDMLASFSGDAYARSENSQIDNEEQPLYLDEGDMVDDEVPQNLEFVSSFYNPDLQGTSAVVTDTIFENENCSIASPSPTREISEKYLLESFEERVQVAPGDGLLDLREDHFGAGPAVKANTLKEKIGKGIHDLSTHERMRKSPLRARIRGFHVIWNLFDGYDWQNTRDTISHAVADVQHKAALRNSRKDKRKSQGSQDQHEDVIGDFLFNSIYIGIPANRDPTELARQVNRNIDDLDSDTGSYATSTSSSSPSRQGQSPHQKGKRLRLKRSKHHKMTFELKGVAADVLVLHPESSVIKSSIDIRIQDLEVFDHVPSSTWKKFVTYMHDAGERESGSSMLRIEITNVKPVPDLSASETLLKVCPLILYTASLKIH